MYLSQLLVFIKKMEGQDILLCINKFENLQKSFGGILASDDVEEITDIPIYENLSLYDKQKNQITGIKFHSWLQKVFSRVEFPVGFILNTGTHKNGGRHWQSLYIDVEGTSYFFDSYGRSAKKEFKKFEILLRAFYNFCSNFNHNIKIALENWTINKFIENGLKKAITNIIIKPNYQAPKIVRYWDHQIQDDDTNVCGQYSTYFLYNISCKVRNPSIDGYRFFANNFYYFNSTTEKTKQLRNKKICYTSKMIKKLQQYFTNYLDIKIQMF